MSESDQDLCWAIEHRDGAGKKHRTEPLAREDACVKYDEIAKAQMPTMGPPWLNADGKWVVSLFYACEEDAKAIHEQFLRAPPYKRRVKFIDLAGAGKPSGALGRFEEISRHGVKVDIRADD